MAPITHPIVRLLRDIEPESIEPLTPEMMARFPADINPADFVIIPSDLVDMMVNAICNEMAVGTH